MVSRWQAYAPVWPPSITLFSSSAEVRALHSPRNEPRIIRILACVFAGKCAPMPRFSGGGGPQTGGPATLYWCVPSRSGKSHRLGKHSKKRHDMKRQQWAGALAIAVVAAAGNTACVGLCPYRRERRGRSPRDLRRAVPRVTRKRTTRRPPTRPSGPMRTMRPRVSATRTRHATRSWKATVTKAYRPRATRRPGLATNARAREFSRGRSARAPMTWRLARIRRRRTTSTSEAATPSRRMDRTAPGKGVGHTQSLGAVAIAELTPSIRSARRELAAVEPRARRTILAGVPASVLALPRRFAPRALQR